MWKGAAFLKTQNSFKNNKIYKYTTRSSIIESRHKLLDPISPPPLDLSLEMYTDNKYAPARKDGLPSERWNQISQNGKLLTSIFSRKNNNVALKSRFSSLLAFSVPQIQLIS